MPTRVDVGEVHAGRGVIYFSRLVSRAAQSRFYRVFAPPIYQSMTIRNWITTTKLLRKMDEAAGAGVGG